MLLNVSGIGSKQTTKDFRIRGKTCDPSVLKRPEKEDPSGQYAIEQVVGVVLAVQSRVKWSLYVGQSLREKVDWS